MFRNKLVPDVNEKVSYRANSSSIISSFINRPQTSQSQHNLSLSYTICRPQTAESRDKLKNYIHFDQNPIINASNMKLTDENDNLTVSIRNDKDIFSTKVNSDYESDNDVLSVCSQGSNVNKY